MRNKNFKVATEEWANEIMKKYPKFKETMKDFTEIMMFGSIGFRYKDGEYTKITQQELWEMKLHPDSEVTTFNSIEEYREHLNSAKSK